MNEEKIAAGLRTLKLSNGVNVKCLTLLGEPKGSFSIGDTLK
jgi:hypothetical protein